jgi:segregation and condensation protein B
MSLKAKIEAVIYASEEPVTLVQLVGLLGEEGQAELDALASNQLSLEGVGEPEPAEDAALESAEDEAAVATEETAPAPEEPAVDAAPVEEDAPELTTDEAPAASDPSANDPAATEAAAELDAKALAAAAKLRERRLREYFRSLLDQLIADYQSEERGLEIKEVAGGFRLATKPEYHDAVRGFVKSLKPPLKLSLQALETLAVVAYKQPVTAPEVSEIRGVDSGGVLASLMTRKLIQTAGRKQVIGRPMLYKTSKEFLVRFGLKDINELPSIEEFEKMAGELNDAVQEELPVEAEAAVAMPSSVEVDGDVDTSASEEAVEAAATDEAAEVNEAAEATASQDQPD